MNRNHNFSEENIGSGCSRDSAEDRSLREDENLLPDNSPLTMGLATRAFQMVGQNRFSVSACLSADSTESLRNFGMLQSILLMAYNQGVQDAKQGKEGRSDLTKV